MLLALAIAVAAPSSRADDAAGCGDAFDQSQLKRDAGKLLEARRLLRICQAPVCLPTQQKLCSAWLADVEARVPSVVLAAKDGAGADLVDVKVTMDGAPITTRLDGRAIDVDPGPHSFVFELADGTRADAMAVADEHAKGKPVTVVLRRAPAVETGPAPSVIAPQPPAAPAATTLLPTQAASSGSTLRTTGLVVGGAGVVGLALGAVFGVAALSAKGSHCDASGHCDPGTANDVYGKATASTIGFVAGGLLLAGGATMWLVAPKGAGDVGGVALGVAPSFGPSTGGLRLEGSW